MSTRPSHKPYIIGFLSLFLLTVATATSLLVPSVTSAASDSLVAIDTPTPSPTTPAPPPATFVRRVNLPVNDFVYSSSAQSIYAAIPSIAGVGRGNTITKINPTNGAIDSSVFIGSEPNRMAISNDGQTIYVRLDGAYAIRRFDVPTQTAGLQFVPQAPFTYLEDMAVQPGNPQVIALANIEGVAIYDNGIQRPVSGDGGAYGIYSIDFADAATLYGYDNYSSGFELIKFNVNSSGVTGVNIGNNLISGFGVKIKYSNGLIYSTSGRVVNPASRTLVGTFPTGGSLMAIDQALGRIFFMEGNVITAYDTNTFLRVGTVTLPTFTGAAYGLVRWGDNGLAFRAINSGGTGSNNSQLYLIQSEIVSPTAAVPTGIQVGAQTYNGNENVGNLQIAVTRTGSLTTTSTIDYATSDGTATAGTDYTATAGTITFAPGEASKTINISIINDNVFEGTESFNFTLSNPVGGTNINLLSPNTAVLTINDNDNQPNVSASNISVSEPPIVGTSTALFTVRLTNPTTQTATVNFATVNGTATAGSDYVATSGTLTFAPLETTKTIAVQILADSNFTEPNETFTIGFSNAVNATVFNPQVTATIINYNPQTARHVRFDFDGDGKSDMSVFRPENGIWYLLNSQTGYGGLQFGIASDKLVPADYDGDGKTDVVVYRDGAWYLQLSALGFTNVQFGEANDIPVPADFDGDGKADIAVFRPSTGTWYIQGSTAGFTTVQFGSADDKPVAADFDGDGKADYAVFRPSTGIWYVQQSTAGFTGLQFGSADDKLVVADYDGDRKADYAVYRPSTGFWYLQRSQLGFTGIQFGQQEDIPVPADYDGDGRADIGVYRNDTWLIQRSTSGFTGVQFGSSVDKPIPNAFVR